MASNVAITNPPRRAARNKPRGTAHDKTGMETVTVAAAKKNFDGILKSAAHHPVTVTHGGEPAAVMISPQCYREVARLLQLLEEIEDRGYVEKMRAAAKEGYLTPEENAAFMREMFDDCGI